MQNIRSRIRDQQGFTLIEIVMVIVLLGVLAAIAIPKFVDLKRDAQEATADGIVAAVSSSAAIGYAKAAIAGTATYPDMTDLDASYLSVKNVQYWGTAPAAGGGAFTANIKGYTYALTYDRTDGSCSRTTQP
jgi:prepilin-type N-terminal cleavage/methylation domain-containing protein